MRNQLEDENISKLPFIFSIQTIQRDSILLKPPSGVNLND